MANGQDNLIPLNKRSKEVQRQIQEMGREANKQRHKEKASFKQAIKWLAENGDLRVTEGDLYDWYIKNGIDISNLDPTKIATIGLWFGAATGKAENYKVLMEGNNEVEQTSETPDVSINIIDNKALEKIMYKEEEE